MSDVAATAPVPGFPGTGAADRRPPGRPALAAMLEARTVALVGASPRPGSLGERMVSEVTRSPSRPQVYLVNPRHKRVAGHPCHASLADLPVTIERLLAEIQQSLHDKALAFRQSNTHDAKTYNELKKAVESGFAFSFWCGSADCEAKIKEETRATMRCIPLEQEGGSGTCVCCAQPATARAIFARAY